MAKRYFQLIVTLIISLLYQVTAGQGILQGTIKDSRTQESLPGATVLIQGTTMGASTDLDGKFLISNVKAGTYKIIISYISYQTDTLNSIRVQTGKVINLDHSLNPLSIQINGVVVQGTAKTNTDVSIISSIKKSNLIVSGVSSQQISRSLDKDASEVIKRVPGITIIDGRFVVVRGLIERYNSVWLNNAATPSTETDQRAFSFDVIPSNLINNILIFKTPAPELPADFAGAAIQVFTNNLPEKNSITAGYTTSANSEATFGKFYSYRGGKTDWLGFDDGTRNLSSGVPSTEEMIIYQNYNSGTPEEQAERKAKMLEISRSFSDISGISEKKAPLDQKFNLDMNKLFKVGSARIGNITALSYKNSFNHASVERSSVESYGTTSTGVTYSKHYLDEQYSKSVEIGGLHNWSLSRNTSVYKFRNLFYQKGRSQVTIRTGTDHYRDDNRLNQTQLAYLSKTIYSGELSGEHKFREDQTEFNWTLGYSYAGRNEPDIRQITYYSTKISDSLYYPYQLDYSASPNTEANGRLFSRVTEHSLSGNLNYSRRLKIAGTEPEIKAGLYAEKKDREFRIRPFGLVWAKPGIYNTEILHQPIDSVYDYSNFNFTNGIIYREVYNSRYHYRADNLLAAGYISVKLPVTSFLNIYGGVRAENNRLELSEFQSRYDTLTPNILHDSLNFFPSVNITFNFTDKSLLRLAYGKTINRPEFREAAPFAFYDFQENVVIYGNDTIKSCYINNFDIRYEWYPSIGEMITFGIFYKNFENPIEATWTPASSGEWDLRYLNARHATSLGIEIDIRKSLRFLEKKDNFLKHLRGLTLVANASIIKCRVETDLLFVRDQNRPMYGQSPYIVNAGIYYQDDEGNLSVNLLYNIYGKRIIGIGTPEKPNAYELPRNNLDLVFQKKIRNGWSLKLGVKDILNEKVIVQQVMTSETLADDAIIHVKAYSPGRTFSAGLSYTF